MYYLSKIRRYALAGIGPVALAGTHFALSFVMLRLHTPAAFGTFTFLFVAAQFTVALSSALFGAPLQSFASARQADGGGRVEAVFAVATALALLIGAGFLTLGLSMQLPVEMAVCYGGYTTVMIVRWLGRAWCFADGRPERAVASDLVYALVTLSCLAAGTGSSLMSMDSASYAALFTGALASLLPFGRGHVALAVRWPTRDLRATYRDIWRRHARWSLLSVTATELAANAHVYLVTIVAGASAVAPLAAAALLLRPMNVLQNALTEYERPQMAALLADDAVDDLRRSRRFFLVVLLLAWCGTGAAAAAILVFAPQIVFSAQYDLSMIRWAAVGWFVIALLIVLQMPSSVMLQGAGRFRALARATLISSATNVTGVAIVLAIAAPIWTIAVMVIGWGVELALVHRAAQRLLAGYAHPGSA
ncbi:hypothetical protein F1C10_03165 [Sphingomonas sp. NBWT7]|uniref:hypothetical protein n=1 Tax=Sphingomonas sp. NBWT7 TaxID=2596913 RepID=UPI0016289DB1|nr:hypothetical protein [Sphingomonas sp. NBWT7]QNE31048.1 hypothetical protein F1C10_03165 [Sphingomonas sp. NBWT7]